jgi:NAD(P)-dependent dehydrogenase (short-subunit alcohol dehydrogenase family)
LARKTAPAWSKRGARIISLSPGIIDTPMGRQELSQQPMMQGMIDAVGRMGTAEEVAAVAAFLVSPAASFVTGTDVLVDGGSVAIVKP